MRKTKKYKPAWKFLNKELMIFWIGNRMSNDSKNGIIIFLVLSILYMIHPALALIPIGIFLLSDMIGTW